MVGFVCKNAKIRIFRSVYLHSVSTVLCGYCAMYSRFVLTIHAHNVGSQLSLASFSFVLLFRIIIISPRKNSYLSTDISRQIEWKLLNQTLVCSAIDMLKNQAFPSSPLSSENFEGSHQENVHFNFGQLSQLCKVVKLPKLPEFDNFGK